MTSVSTATHVSGTATGRGTRAARGGSAAPVTAVSTLRDETCATLDSLDAAAKGRASIVRSCTEIRSLTPDDREALKDLLRCITEQRKRLRAVRRVWQSIDIFERPSTGLVEATQLCIRESRELAAALDPWRVQTVNTVSASVSKTWLRLASVVDHFLSPDAEPTSSDMAHAV